MAPSRFSSVTSILLLLSLLGIASAGGDYGSGPSKPGQSYNPKPQVPRPKLPKFDGIPKPKIEKPDFGYGPTLPIAIEGLVLCKSGPKFVPIKVTFNSNFSSAVVRIACLGEDDNGYETTKFSCLTNQTDASGYFFKTLPLFGLKKAKVKYTECKAYLEHSPLETCKVPTDVNRSIRGALLSSYRILNNKKIKLYSVGPFICTSDSKPSPGGNY